MKRPHLLARCLEPVAMTEDALRVCIAVVTDDAYFADDRAKALTAAGGFPMLDGRASMAVKDGVATIAVEGPLVRKMGAIAEVSALTSYDALRSEFRAALADPQVKSIDWMFDTNGGEVSGLFEFADEVHAARGTKPMRAIVSRANSAGYVLAAAVGNIEIEQMGQAGSVGAILGVQRKDASGDVIEFVSSVSPRKVADPTTDAGRAEYQTRADYAGEKLVEKVALYRGVTVEDVKQNYGGGSVLLGAQAVAAGMADRIAAITTAPRAPAPPRKGAMPMTMQAEATEAAATPAPDPFRAQILSALGVDSDGAALGKLAALVADADALRTLRADVAQREAEARAKSLRESLTAAVSGGRLSLAELSRVVPALCGANAGKAREAMQAAAEQTAPALIGALASVPLDAGACEAIGAYLDAKAPPALPVPHAEPARDTRAESERIDPARAEAIDRAMNVTPINPRAAQ